MTDPVVVGPETIGLLLGSEEPKSVEPNDPSRSGSQLTDATSGPTRAWPDDRARNQEFAAWLNEVTNPGPCPRRYPTIQDNNVVVKACVKNVRHIGKCRLTEQEGGVR